MKRPIQMRRGLKGLSFHTLFFFMILLAMTSCGSDITGVSDNNSFTPNTPQQPKSPDKPTDAHNFIVRGNLASTSGSYKSERFRGFGSTIHFSVTKSQAESHSLQMGNYITLSSINKKSLKEKNQ